MFFEGRGSLGRFTITSMMDRAENPFGDAWNPSVGCPAGWILVSAFTSGGNIQRFEDGDLLYWGQDHTSPDNILCINPEFTGYALHV